MSRNVTPMIHVPDVQATVDWYASIGFAVLGNHTECGKMTWAKLAFGDGKIMFNEGGEQSLAHRREVDLYIETTKIDELFENLKGRVDVFEPPHDTHYGMREFIIRDLNRFWLTFGQPMEYS